MIVTFKCAGTVYDEWTFLSTVMGSGRTLQKTRRDFHSLSIDAKQLLSWIILAGLEWLIVLIFVWAVAVRILRTELGDVYLWLCTFILGGDFEISRRCDKRPVWDMI